MGLKVVSCTTDSLILSAPIANNINHQNSAFGGSLYSVAVLAGWGLIQLKLSELGLDCNTVVVGAGVSYRKPVFGDLRCICSLPEAADDFFDKLAKDGKATTSLISEFELDDQIAMRLKGRYQVQRR